VVSGDDARKVDDLNLGNARRIFDAACRNLGVSIPTLDVQTRQRLVDCIIRLMRQGERNPDALQKRAIIYVRNTGRD